MWLILDERERVDTIDDHEGQHMQNMVGQRCHTLRILIRQRCIDYNVAYACMSSKRGETNNPLRGKRVSISVDQFLRCWDTIFGVHSVCLGQRCTWHMGKNENYNGAQRRTGQHRNRLPYFNVLCCALVFPVVACFCSADWVHQCGERALFNECYLFRCVYQNDFMVELFLRRCCVRKDAELQLYIFLVSVGKLPQVFPQVAAIWKNL